MAQQIQYKELEMSHVGSLIQFIDQPLYSDKHTNRKIMNRSQEKTNHSINQKTRSKTVIDSYKASIKHSISSKRYPTTEAAIQEIKHPEIHQKLFAYPTSKKLSERIMIFPKRQNFMQFIKKRRPKPEQTLLRCIDKIENRQQTKNDQNTILKKLGQKLNHKNLERQLYFPIETPSKQSDQIVGNGQSFILKQKKSKKKISSRKRIEFENCIQWAKKHRKNASYYERQLGKNISPTKLKDFSKQRKQIMKKLYQPKTTAKSTRRSVSQLNNPIYLS